MKKLRSEDQNRLIEIFGERVNFKLYERRLYSSDIGTMPGIVKGRIKSIPVAVVLPESEEEILKLFKLSKERVLPLVPRGLGTSGYGGSVPARGGISVVFSQMNKIINIDNKNLIVTVQPGIIWKDLERKLNLKGLSLKLYPSSFPGSTVGGWLAQGGIGIGSLKYGAFKDNVINAKVVSPDGKVKTYKDEELDLVSGSMGTTGIITEITFSIKEIESINKKLLSFQELKDLKVFLNTVYENKVDLWSATFVNPELAKQKNKLDPVE